MSPQSTITLLALTISALSPSVLAQGFSESQGLFTCYPGGGAFCAAGNIIIRCSAASGNATSAGTPFNCQNTDIYYYPPVDGYATCNQTSTTSGDAICCKGDVCADGASAPLQSATMALPSTLSGYTAATLTSFSSFTGTGSVAASTTTTVTSSTVAYSNTTTTTATSGSSTAKSTSASSTASVASSSVSGSATLVSSTKTIVSGSVTSTTTAVVISTPSAVASGSASMSTPSVVASGSSSVIPAPITSTVLATSTVPAGSVSSSVSTSTALISQITDGQIQATTAAAPAAVSTVAPYAGAGNRKSVIAGVVGIVAGVAGVALI